ncbi:fasciclin domain-containing protein [Dokdonia ponticola]|uniref:Fasciclin domain-containing protein n=1 Tax=Dokdonia ponticola TaxID=2041041 RepID=A0ABV9HT50_9FLAO
MKKTILIFAMLTLCFSAVSTAQSDVVDVAISSKDHTTLVTAVKAAGLVNTLKGEGPFTVFAPTNTAFDALPEGTLESLLKPEAKNKLSAILTYHVVAGNFKAADVIAAIKNGAGKFIINTVNGGSLTASLKGNNVILTDTNGNVATITATDLKASNGIVHVIDSVVLPK